MSGCFNAYLDESGCFQLATGLRDTVGIALTPDSMEFRADLAKFVTEFEAASTAAERRVGKVNGCKIRAERLLEVLAFARRAGVKLSSYTVEQKPRSGATDDKIRAATSIRRSALVSGVADEAEVYARALENLNDNDRYYCDIVTRLLFEGAVGQWIRAGSAECVNIVYDRRLNGTHRDALHNAIHVTLAAIRKQTASLVVQGILAPPSRLGIIRQGMDSDRHGLQLVDWLLYPIALYFRTTGAEHRRQYEQVWSEIHESGVVVLPDPAQDFERFVEGGDNKPPPGPSMSRARKGAGR